MGHEGVACADVVASTNSMPPYSMHGGAGRLLRGRAPAVRLLHGDTLLACYGCGAVHVHLPGLL
jgi:hypothetical protein